MTPTAPERSDDELLLAARDEPDAFAVFYRRHVRALAAYFWRRSHDAETVADLMAETFATALDGCGRFDSQRGPAVGWLYGIAHRQLGTLARRGAVERRARRRLGMERLELDDVELARIESDAKTEGPHARVLAEQAGGVSELVARKRVFARAVGAARATGKASRATWHTTPSRATSPRRRMSWSLSAPMA